MSDRIVNAQGQVLWDEADELKQLEAHRIQRDGEPFTAAVDCPACGHLAVHWLDAPRFEPTGDEPMHRAMRLINDSIQYVAMYAGRPPKRRWDVPGTVVGRICIKCDYRWGQS